MMIQSSVSECATNVSQASQASTAQGLLPELWAPCALHDESHFRPFPSMVAYSEARHICRQAVQRVPCWACRLLATVTDVVLLPLSPLVRCSHWDLPAAAGRGSPGLLALQIASAQSERHRPLPARPWGQRGGVCRYLPKLERSRPSANVGCDAPFQWSSWSGCRRSPREPSVKKNTKGFVKVS